VKLSKDVNQTSYKKLMVKVIQEDGDSINFMIQLFRKERDYNAEFYDTYINATRQLQKEQEKIDIYFCMRKIKIIIIME